MGNQQDRLAKRTGEGGGGPSMRQGDRQRQFSGGGATGTGGQSQNADDECPVQMKLAKHLGGGGGGGGSGAGGGAYGPSMNSTPSLQFEDTENLPVVIKWHDQGNKIKSVLVSGSWDGWKKRFPLVKSNEDFTTILEIPPGKHELKYLVDGKWLCDEVRAKTDNKVGVQNNVLNVDKADFCVFDALDKDLAASGCRDATKRAEGNNHETPNERELEKLKQFTQEIPDRRDFERTHNPPVLPPHLLQVILNKDTPVQCDPNVLPEPNHVMLNHLYALSIKDGVMVLSATHRYRKKYVTTLLYKPI